MREPAAADDRRIDQSSLSPPATSGPTGAGVVVFGSAVTSIGFGRAVMSFDACRSRGAVVPTRWRAAGPKNRRKSHGSRIDRLPSGGVGIEAMYDEETRRRILDGKRRCRARRIDQLHRDACRSGATGDRRFWCLVYDLARAPWTTNLEQLREIGLDPPMPDAIDDDELGAALDAVISGLAVLQVFLLHTDHLDDRSCYRRLRLEVLHDRVRDVPPMSGSREWIDLAGGRDRSAHLAVHATEAERASLESSGVIVPPRMERRADRDRRLPRPASA